MNLRPVVNPNAHKYNPAHLVWPALSADQLNPQSDHTNSQPNLFLAFKTNCIEMYIIWNMAVMLRSRNKEPKTYLFGVVVETRTEHQIHANFRRCTKRKLTLTAGAVLPSFAPGNPEQKRLGLNGSVLLAQSSQKNNSDSAHFLLIKNILQIQLKKNNINHMQPVDRSSPRSPKPTSLQSSQSYIHNGRGKDGKRWTNDSNVLVQRVVRSIHRSSRKAESVKHERQRVG